MNAPVPVDFGGSLDVVLSFALGLLVGMGFSRRRKP